MTKGTTGRRQFMKTAGTSAVALSAGLSSTQSHANPSQRPNVLWISCEDMSPTLGCYGDTFATSPTLDALARRSTLYRHAYATAPICAPSRSCLITGVYATTLGTQHLRSDVPIPDFIRPFPLFLREAGFFCSNNVKADYNFSPEGIWDDWSPRAHWRNRGDGRPFFSVFNIMTTHASRPNMEEELHQETFGERLKQIPPHDPDSVPLPPYYPDTPETRRLWARYYDHVQLMDQEVQTLLDQLEEDGLADNTIVFFFSDHGHGMPRGKRWLYDSGLQVPLIVHVPERFQHLCSTEPGDASDELVSFVDYAPTVLHLCGVDTPEYMQGISFLGNTPSPRRRYITGCTSRADEMWELGRAVRDHRYKYIRYYLPHLPYIQPSFAPDQHATIKELRRVFAEEKTPADGRTLWGERKPIEELYDTETDPHELNNLVNDPAMADVLERLRRVHHRWTLETRDLDFLPEAEYHIRSEGSSPYEMALDPDRYDIETVFEAAKRVGKPDAIPQALAGLDHDDNGVRYWSLMAIRASESDHETSIPEVTRHRLLDDPSPSVAILAAEVFCLADLCQPAMNTLRHYLNDERDTVVLQAARSIQTLGEHARPLAVDIAAGITRYAGTQGMGNKYRDMNYAMFISWALEASREAIR